MRRLAQHIVDEGIAGYLIAIPLHGRSFRCIQDVLNSVSLEPEVLRWVQAQLSAVQGAPPSPGRAMEITMDDNLEFYHAYPEALARWRQDVSARIGDESARQEFAKLTDEEFLVRARELGSSFLSSVNRIIGSEMPYGQKYEELQELKVEWPDQGGDPNAVLSEDMRDKVDDVLKYHDIYVRSLANFNALRAAIEIYLVEAESGLLPEMLPPHLPEDPFSGQDFEYEKTSQGFVLRCRQKEIGEDKLWAYDFRVAQ